jgi:acetyltransferase-like isoleucine patch superfamily enzyme
MRHLREGLAIALAAPWKLGNEVSRLAVLPLARLRFALAGVTWGEGWMLYGVPIVQRHRAASIHIGARCALRSTFASNPLAPAHPVVLTAREPGALLTIGDDFGMTGGSIVCALRVTIGDRVMVGANSVITDTDFHPLDPLERRAQPSAGARAPVVIGDDVFIGMGCLILKGVTIGAGAVIGAGSVVTRDVPPGAVAAGNPARVVKDAART